MLPPVLEIYAVWHPDDGPEGGREIAKELVNHFHGTLFSGLIGGAVEIYVRSEDWKEKDGAPRPIPFPGSPPPNGVAPAEITAVVPIIGVGLASAVENAGSAWRDYLGAIVSARLATPDRVGVFPAMLEGHNVSDTTLSHIMADLQLIAAPSVHAPPEPPGELRCRDLGQAIAQLTEQRGDGKERLTVFISHTKRYGFNEEAQVAELIHGVRTIIGNTRLSEFFDAHDLQPGQNWDEELRDKAATSALLCLRTDLYATREWCQREVLIAKRAGMPVIILDALGSGEERGCFLMDHVPRVPVRRDQGGWRHVDIRRGLNLLVDECLKRALWRRQRALATGRPDLEVAWWAPHAPEPTTLTAWIEAEKAEGRLGGKEPIRILHPDPPLGADERLVLEQIACLSGLAGRVEVMTPHMLAARGG
jgi:hypothetical protein